MMHSVLSITHRKINPFYTSHTLLHGTDSVVEFTLDFLWDSIMNTIDTVMIENLWGDKSTIEFSCDRKFNFLIGENGTGKTTVINLIAATLTGDFEKLDKIEFDRIRIVLKPTSGNKKPSIDVIKSKRPDVPFYDIAYELKQSQKDKPLSFDLDKLETEIFFRNTPQRAFRERMFKGHFLDVRRQLEDLVNVSWLSIHRQNEEPQTMEERKSIPPIDQKISSLNNSLVKYFSSLSKRHSDNITEFQKRILLSVITSERSEALSAFLKNIDIDRETMALTGVFEVLGVEKKHYAQKIRNHFEKFNQAIESRNKEDTKFSFDQFSAIYNTWRSHSLVQDYEKLQNKKIDIFKSRDIFIEVLNNGSSSD